MGIEFLGKSIAISTRTLPTDARPILLNSCKRVERASNFGLTDEWAPRTDASELEVYLGVENGFENPVTCDVCLPQGNPQHSY